MSQAAGSTTLGPGAVVGPYRIEALLGTGAMGYVFRARDTRLDRLVAIKTSRVQFDARFEREARTIAQLNHPHICTLYDVGADYLVMELVEGETLADRLAHGPLPLAAVLKYGKQVANALAAAHAKGIAHRDLKPQNIMIAKSGAKVLDFGIAKTSDPSLTETDAIIGTPAYMAPEQLRGRPADARSDLYALGLVLRDMAEGLGATRKPLSKEKLPRQLVWTIERCLAADPDDRWQSALDVGAALELIGVSDDVAAPRAANTRWRWLAGAAGLALVAAAAVYGLRVEAPERVLRYALPAPQGTSYWTLGESGPPVLSPDGRLVAFVARGESGQQLWVRSLDSFDARPLPGTEGASFPFWSPNSDVLGFVARGELKTLSLTSGQARVLATGVLANSPGTWSEEGTILFSPRAITLATVEAGGGDVTQATTIDAALLEENHMYPVFLPDGRHYLVQVRGGPELEYQIWLGRVGSNDRTLVLERASNAQYAPPYAGAPGYLVFARDRRLLAQQFDAKALTLIGEATTIADRVAISPTGGPADFSVSSRGVLAYRVDNPAAQEMAWYDRGGKQVGSVGDSPGNGRGGLRLSPSGRAVAFARQGTAAQDVWVHDLERGVATRMTFDGGRSPTWSPDGSQIAFLRGDTIMRSAAGGGAEVALWTAPGTLSVNDWSGDGAYLLFTRWDSNAGRGLWLLPNPLDDAANHEPLLLESRGLHGQFVPSTGTPRFVSYDDDEGTTREIFLRAMPGGAPGKWQLSSGGGNAARWRDDGREVYFVSGGTVLAVSVDGDATPVIGAQRPLFSAARPITTATFWYAPSYDVSGDGERFLATYSASETPPDMINIVINWQAALATGN
jgi:Tol biopolymer transport system component